MADLPILESAQRTSFGTLSGEGGGGPTLLTPARARIIIEALERGMPYAVAAQQAGIDADTFLSWRKKGEAGTHPIYVEFLEAVKAALAHYEEKHLANIDDAAFGTDDRKPAWQASAWRLERDQRLEGRHARQAVIKTDDDSEVIKFELTVTARPDDLSQEQLRAVLEARARRTRAVERSEPDIQEADFTVEEEEEE